MNVRHAGDILLQWDLLDANDDGALGEILLYHTTHFHVLLVAEDPIRCALDQDLYPRMLLNISNSSIPSS
jgi:hypothetical protein